MGRESQRWTYLLLYEAVLALSRSTWGPSFWIIVKDGIQESWLPEVAVAAYWQSVMVELEESSEKQVSELQSWEELFILRRNVRTGQHWLRWHVRLGVDFALRHDVDWRWPLPGSSRSSDYAMVGDADFAEVRVLTIWYDIIFFDYITACRGTFRNFGALLDGGCWSQRCRAVLDHELPLRWLGRNGDELGGGAGPLAWRQSQSGLLQRR